SYSSEVQNIYDYQTMFNAVNRLTTNTFFTINYSELITYQIYLIDLNIIREYKINNYKYSNNNQINYGD
ncbi:MAG: hypothetical protein QW478_12940, partial [Candidatus Micrarchaeaceae archaeon]